MQLRQKLKVPSIMITFTTLIIFLINGMSEVTFKITKRYSPPKLFIKDVEPQSYLNKKYTLNDVIYLYPKKT